MKTGHELAQFMQKNQVSPTKTMVLPFVQVNVDNFVYFFENQ